MGLKRAWDVDLPFIELSTFAKSKVDTWLRRGPGLGVDHYYRLTRCADIGAYVPADTQGRFGPVGTDISGDSGLSRAAIGRRRVKSCLLEVIGKMPVTTSRIQGKYWKEYL